MFLGEAVVTKFSEVIGADKKLSPAANLMTAWLPYIT